MAEAFPAVCFRDDLPGSCPCTVSLRDATLVIHGSDGPVATWRYDALGYEPTGDERAWLLVTPRQGSPSGPVTALVARDPALLAALAERVGEPDRSTITGLAAGRHALARRHWRSLGLFAVAAALALAGGWWAVTNLAPEVAAELMPVETERQLGSALATAFLADKETVPAGPAVAAVEGIVARLAAAADTRGTTFTVHVVDDPQVNALALPGGQIVVFTGLLREAGSAEEVAGVLAHEIQHVLRRHAIKRLVQQFGSAAVIGAATGGGNLGRLAGRAGELVQLSYGRDQESEADREGIALLHRAGLPPESMTSFFERLRRMAPDGLPELLATHPDTGRRIEEARRLAAALPKADRVPLAIDWDDVRASLGPR
ncbi:MAG: M48 family metallopeptidase [Planctomycetes bacterium]|nr:M48 family metallopeptidase [Planctomycetota bacterium]